MSRIKYLNYRGFIVNSPLNLASISTSTLTQHWHINIICHALILTKMLSSLFCTVTNANVNNAMLNHHTKEPTSFRTLKVRFSNSNLLHKTK